MALDDKDILITPNTGNANEPKIEFVGADASGNDTITLSAGYDGTVSTLSFEASSGQLFSVANVDSDGDGYLFAVNDKSGIPSLQVELDGTVILNPNVGNVLVGTSTDDGSNVFQVSGNSKLTGDVSGITDLYIDDQIISTGDTNTYFQFHAADQMRMVAGGAERLEITNVSPHVLVTGNLKVQGNIEATGSLDTTGQNDLAVTDRKITLNDGETASGVNGGTGGELAVSGIFIDRGSLDSASFVFDEVDDTWKARLNSGFDTPALAAFAASTLEGNLNWSYIQDKPDPVVTVELSGDVTGSGNATLTDLGNGTVSLTTTIAANSVALGTDTTGAYVADIVQGNAISISETANNAEGNVVTINHADTSSVGNLSSDNANGVALQDISFTFDSYGHTTAASVATTDLDLRYIRSFQVEDGDGTEVTINQANEWKFVEGAGTGASIDINWTDSDNGTDADPYDLTFTVTNTDRGSSQNIFKTVSIDSDSGFTWAAQGDVVAETNNDTLSLVSGNDLNLHFDATDDAILIKHKDITRTDTTSNASPSYGGTFDVIDLLTTNERGHVTAANVTTVTIPASDNTNTTYDLSIIQTGGDDDNPAIRLAAGGSGSGNDDLTLTGGGAITITRGSDTGLTIEHTDTSTQADVDNSGNSFIQDITLDTYGHVTGLTSATTSIGDATITLSAGTDLETGGDFTTNQHADSSITFNHSDITRSDTTSTDTPAYGGTFEAVTSVTSSARGHITAIDVSTITIPASDNTDTTYSISAEAGDDTVSEKIRLTAGGSGSGSDDIILAVAQTGSTDGLDISASGDTITFKHHDTSALTGQQGTAGIANITVDEMGHVTAVGTATYNNYVHPSYTARSIAVDTSGVDVLDTLNITVDTIGSVTVADAATRTLPSAGSSTTGVVTSSAQTFGGKKTFAGGIELTNSDLELRVTGTLASSEIIMEASDVSGNSMPSAIKTVGLGISAGSEIVFETKDGSSVQAERMRINRNGNVTIDHNVSQTSQIPELSLTRSGTTDLSTNYGPLLTIEPTLTDAQSNLVPAGGIIGELKFGGGSMGRYGSTLPSVFIRAVAAADWALLDYPASLRIGVTDASAIGNDTITHFEFLSSGNMTIGDKITFGVTTNQRAEFSGAAGSYLTWNYGSTVVADIGNANQVFSSGGRGTDFGITSRTGRLQFGSNGTNIDAVLDSAGNFGIGTSAPDKKLVVQGANAEIALSDTNSAPKIRFRENGATSGFIKTFDRDLQFGSGGDVERMRLDSDGDLHVENDVIAFSTTLSDRRLKDDIETLDKSLEKILQLRGVSFTWNTGSREGTRDIGVIAQEVEEVIPEIVREKKAVLIDDQVSKTVDYEKLVAVLIEGMKDQQTQIDELREEVQALKGE